MEQTDTIGVGIRGTGQVAKQHAHAIINNPYTYIAAICGRSLEKGMLFKKELNASAAKVYDCYEKMLEDPLVTVISECMPNYLHAKEGLLALSAGKHLILEKPAGITPEETESLYEAAARSQTKTVVSFVLRWHPLIKNMRRLLDLKAFGDIYYAEADYWHGIRTDFSSYEWIRKQQFAGGAMITGGSHAVDIIRYLHGEVDEVSAYATHVRKDFDYMTTYISAIKFKDESVGKVSVSLDGTMFPYQFNIDLLGTRGACRNNQFYAKDIVPEQDDWMSFACETPSSGKVEHHPFQQEIDNLIEAILYDKPVLCDIQDACRSMRVVYAIHESALTGKPIKVQ